MKRAMPLVKNNPSLSVIIMLAVSGLCLACSRTESHLSECRYETEKLLVTSSYSSNIGRDPRIGELVYDCMKARGFEFNFARSYANSQKKKYSEYLDSVMDDGNWDHWWWAKLTHKKVE